MSIEFIYPEFEVIRNEKRCTVCRICERQCANEVHSYDEKHNIMKCDESKCVNCQRCVSFCPANALKIVKSDCSLRENAKAFFYHPWVTQNLFLFIGIKS